MKRTTSSEIALAQQAVPAARLSMRAILGVGALSATILACSPGELSRSKAESLLQDRAFRYGEYNRSLSDLIKNEPEFSELRNVRLCKSKPQVTGIIHPDKTLAVAEFHLVYEYDKDLLDKWLAAFSKLDARTRSVQRRTNLKTLVESIRTGGGVTTSNEKWNATFQLYDDSWRLQ